MAFNVSAVNAAEKSKEIKAFWKDHFTGWQEGKLDWFYLNNPQGKAKCWVITNEENGQIIGTVVVFPRYFYYSGKEILTGITGDFGVSKNYRILGPALKLQKNTLELCSKDGYQFLYGFPNTKSEPVQRRAGYTVIGASRRLVKVLDSKEYIQRKTGSALLAALIAPIVNLGLRITGRENRIGVPAKYVVQTELKFDAAFDSLWTKGREQFKLIGKRDSVFLNWRFGDCPFREYKLFAIREKETDQPAGYVVYYTEGQTAFIADMFARDMATSMDILLAGFLKYLRKSRLQSVSVLYFGRTDILTKLKQFGFSEREDRRNVVAYAGEANPHKDDFLKEENWYFFEADND